MAEAPALAFDVKGEAIFKEGYQFEPMTYTSLCEFVAFESCRLGGPAIRPIRRLDSTGIVQYVDFYCPHGRKHADQAEAKDDGATGSACGSSLKTKGQDDRRILFCDCSFSIRVRRDPKVVPIHLADPEGNADSVEAEKGTKAKEQQKQNEQNSRIVYGWYVDCLDRQQQEGRYKKNFHCFKHTGHIKRSQRVADVTIAIRDFIKEHAKHNISESLLHIITALW